MKYIDADKLIAETERLRKNAWSSFQKGNSTEEQYYLRYGIIKYIISFITSLQQEQPEVDLDSQVFANVEGKETIVETIKEFVEKGKRCMEQAAEEQDPENYIFWDGFHNCSESILREVETGGIRGNLKGIPSNVELKKEIEGTTDDYAEGRRLEQRILEESRRFPEVSFAKLSRIAKHFYDFGKQAGAKWMAEHKESNYE